MKKAKVKYIPRKPKYANGTGYQGVANYMETPSGELTQNQINIAKAKENAASNPWVIGLNVTADLIKQYGAMALGAMQKPDQDKEEATDMASELLGIQEGEGIDTGGLEATGNLGGKESGMANGGRVGRSNVEVENKEVGELPNGRTVEFKGATHENGGIDVNLPNGTEIFSERIKIKGESMADRKKKREKNLLDIQTKLEDNPTDAILKNTLQKIKADNEIADANDMQIQQVIDTLQKGAKGEFALGGITDGVDPEEDEVDPDRGTTVLDFFTKQGKQGVPEHLQGKYIHYKPTTMLNEDAEYYRTLGDLWKNLWSTKRGRVNKQLSGQDQLITPTFANGGITEDGEPDPTAPITTYEGADNWEEYLKHQNQLAQFNTYNDESTRLSEDLGEGTTYDAKKFKSLPGMQGFELPEGATGVVAYKGYQEAGTEISPTLEGNYYTDEKTDTVYIPTYSKPEGNYKVIEDPKVTAEKERIAAWEEETKDIQGYVRNTYYDPDCNCNRTELKPLPVGQEIPTNGTFVPKGSKPPEDWVPKTPSKMKNGGKVEKYPNGGTSGGNPIDPNNLTALLTMISQNQGLGQQIQNMIDMNYTDAPITGEDVNPYLQEDNSVEIPNANVNNEGPFANLKPGEFPGNWDDYQAWKKYKEQGIDPTKVNADGTYGDTGLKLMDETIEGDFVLDNMKGQGEGTESEMMKLEEGESIPEKTIVEQMKALGINPGDLIGLTGNAVSTFAPLWNTLQSRATDTPNINPFKEFGKEGIQKMEEAMQFADDTKTANLQALEERTSSQRKRNRNTARGVNTMRALDLQTEANANIAENQIHNNFAGLMTQLLASQAQLENQQDRMVMSGEQARDLADRQDKDNFYTNLGTDLSTLGLGLQETGKDINVMKQQEVMMNLLNQFSKYGITVDSSGNLGTNG